MQPVSLHELVKDLKITKQVPEKQCKYIDNLFIYFSDLKVYKVVVQVNPLMLKKARKVGLNSEYNIIFLDDIPITVDKELNVNKGNYIALYNPNNADCSIYCGEETEEEQAQRFCS